jgi:hypothetical protein
MRGRLDDATFATKREIVESLPLYGTITLEGDVEGGVGRLAHLQIQVVYREYSFFNPASIMKLVEKEFGAALGKTVVETRDTTGFVVNRLRVPDRLDAVRVLASGIATHAGIDIRTQEPEFRIQHSEIQCSIVGIRAIRRVF